MLAYRHAFHAGNHADVLKHLVLVQVLRHLNLKDKPYRLVDTHAGAGGYSLADAAAQKKGEYRDGIARLWDRTDLPAPLADYVEQVRRFNPDGRLRHYPGSPTLAHAILRPDDQLRLFELHPTDHRTLELGFAGVRNAQVVRADGFAALKGQLPPTPRRGAVLIDPSYEGHRDYGKVVAVLRDALGRFAEGIYLVWYPQVAKAEALRLPRQLKALAPRDWLHATLTVGRPDARGFGLAGSGMFVVNPPHTLRAALKATLPWLAGALAQFDGASWSLEQHSA